MGVYEVHTDDGSVYEVHTEEPQAISVDNIKSGLADVGSKLKEYFTPKGASDLVTSGIKNPLGIPLSNMANFVTNNDTYGKNPVQEAYYNLMPQQEKAADVVANASMNSIPNLAIPQAAKEGLKLPILSGIFPPRPSSMALGELNNLPIGGKYPVVNPEIGIQNAVQKLGNDMPPEQIGLALKEPYNQRVGIPLGEQLTQPKPVLPSEAPPPPRSGEEIFNPEYQKVANKLYPSEVPLSKSGQAIKEGNFTQVRNKYDFANKKWEPINNERGETPTPLNEAKDVLGTILNSAGEPTALDRLNPVLRKAALESPNPEEYAQHFLTEANKAKGLSTPGQSVYSESVSPIQNDVHLDPRYGKLKKAFALANNPDTTFEQVHHFQTNEFAPLIDFSGHGDDINRKMIQVNNAFTNDKLASADANGFGKQVREATNASKDYFRFRDNPISETVLKNQDTPSQLLGKLVKDTGVETANELMTKHVTDPIQQKIVRRGLIDEMNRVSKSDPVKFMNQYDSLTPEVKTAFFGKDKPLIDSLAGTIDTLNKEKSDYALATAKQPTLSIGKKDILSENGNKLDQMMQGNPSELVTNILKDGTPEMARTVTSSLGTEGTKLLRRGIINKLLETPTIKTKSGDETVLNNLSRNFNKVSPEFINETFGEDAPLVNGIRDASKYLSNETTQVGKYPQAARFLPLKQRILLFLPKLIEKYNLPQDIATSLEKNYGAKVANQVLPMKRPGLASTLGINSLTNSIKRPSISIQNENQ